MEDLTQINDIIAAAVDKNSSNTVLISCGLFIIYTIIQKIVEYYKEKAKSEPFRKQAEAINNLTAKVTEVVDSLKKLFDNTERKEHSRIVNVVHSGFLALKAGILSTCIETIVQNNVVENENAIKGNIASSINTEYYRLFSTLSAYEYKNMPISSKLMDEWIAELTTNCIEYIYKTDLSERKILAKDIRIQQLTKYLSLFVEDKSIYLNNLIFNS